MVASALPTPLPDRRAFTLRRGAGEAKPRTYYIGANPAPPRPKSGWHCTTIPCGAVLVSAWGRGRAADLRSGRHGPTHSAWPHCDARCLQPVPRAAKWSSAKERLPPCSKPRRPSDRIRCDGRDRYRCDPHRANRFAQPALARGTVVELPNTHQPQSGGAMPTTSCRSLIP